MNPRYSDAPRGRTVSSTKKGIDFTRLAIAKALRPGIGDAERYAESRWGSKSRVARIATKASIPGLTTGTGAGAQMVDDEGAAAEFFDLVRARSIVGRLPVRRIPFRTRTLTMDEGPRVEWRDEGAAYRTTPLKVTSQTGLDRFDVGALIVASKELLEDQSVDAEVIVRNELVKALSTALDAAFIDPSNSGSAVKPASITNSVTADSPAEGLFEWDTFTGDPANSWFVMHPFTAARMNSAARPNIGANGGNWAGFPVLTSTAHPEGSFTFLDPDAIAVAMDNPEVRSSDETSIEMVDSSSMASGPSVTAATMVSMFQVNSAAIAASLYANWRVVRPEAVQVFDATALGL